MPLGKKKRSSDSAPCRAMGQTYRRGRGGSEENHVVAHLSVQEQSGHGAEAHGQIVGQAVIAQTFTSSSRGHNVHHHRVAAHGHGAKGQAVHHSQPHKHHQGAAERIAQKGQSEQTVGDEPKPPPIERVEQEGCKRSDGQSRKGVEREYDTD